MIKTTLENRNFPVNLQNTELDSITESLEKLNLNGSSQTVNLTAKKVMVIKNAHRDDIHGMIRLGNHQFVTGSKDGCLKIWDDKGNLVKHVWDPVKIDYRKWITALANVDENRWMSGSRDGKVILWSHTGQREKVLDAPPGALHFSNTSKERNLNRVNSLTARLTKKGDLFYYVGRPCHFTVHSAQQSEKSYIEMNFGYCKTNNNDWVYCIHTLSASKALVVTGDKLDVWVRREKSRLWDCSDHLIAPQWEKNAQRPFISALVPLSHNPSTCFGLAIFDGSIACIDIESKKQFFKANEHKGRVWTVENISENVVASCGDDHTIKLWDIRAEQKSQKTLKENIGRVSTLLKLSESLIVSGSCPDDLKKSQARAELTFWDIRSL